jgi:hypothetical protein
MISMLRKKEKPARVRSAHQPLHKDSVVSKTGARRKDVSGKSLEKGGKAESEPIKCASPPCYLREIED